MLLDTVRVALEREITATLDGPLALTRVGGVLPTPDGRLLVGQPEDRTILVLSNNGAIIERIGREGDGPGEFRWISSFGWRQDSLWVSDVRGRRITVFDRSFEAARTEPTPRAGVPIPYVPGKLMLLADGSTLQVPGIHTQLFTRYGESPPPIPITRHFPDGVTETLVELPVGQLVIRVDLGEGAQASIAKPFAAGALIGASSDGRFVAYVDSIETSGDVGSVAVRVMDVSSGRIDTRRVEVDLVPLSQEVEAEAIEKVRGRLAGLDRTVSYGRVKEILNLPSTLPLVSEVSVAQGGSVFLRLSEPSNSWLILTADGRELHLRLPVNEELEHVSDMRIYTTSSGAYGLPTIREYSLGFREGM